MGSTRRPSRSGRRARPSAFSRQVPRQPNRACFHRGGGDHRRFIPASLHPVARHQPIAGASLRRKNSRLIRPAISTSTSLSSRPLKASSTSMSLSIAPARSPSSSWPRRPVEPRPQHSWKLLSLLCPTRFTPFLPTTASSSPDGPTARYMTHMFEIRCNENGIEHRLTVTTSLRATSPTSSTLTTRLGG